MKIFKTLIIFITAAGLIACSSTSTDVSSQFNSDNPGYLSLGFIQAQSYNPTIDHGLVTQYKLTITGSGIAEDIINYYPAGTEAVTFEGFPHGSTIRVTIEALNANGITVRRGYSEDITIIGGQSVSSDITVNNVPIFANVRDGATVYNNRFVPKVFAPGEIQFQISDLFNESQSVMTDQVSNLTQFSISTSDDDSIMPIYAGQLDTGTHSLTVQDNQTGEASTIEVTVLDGSNKKALTTTAGDYLGSLISPDNSFKNNLYIYNTLLTEQ